MKTLNVYNIFFLFFITSILLFSCQKEKEDTKTKYFIKVFGNELQDEGIKIIKGDNNSYYILANSQNQSDKNILLLKVNELGNEQWRHLIVEDSIDNIAHDFYLNQNNELIVLGTTIDSMESAQVFIAKIDQSDGEIWRRNIGEASIDEVGNGILEFTNGESIIVGYYIDESQIKQPYYLRIDAFGEPLRERYTELNNSEYNSIIGYDETHVIATGVAEDMNSSIIKVVLIRVNSGDVEYIYKYPVVENNDDLGIQSYYTDNGNLVVMGNSISEESVNTISFTRFEESDLYIGDTSIIEIKKILSDSENKYISGFARLSSKDGFAVIGASGLSDSYDVYLRVIDNNGDLKFEEHYGSFGNEIGSSIVQTDDGGFLILGTIGKGMNTTIGAGVNTDICLIKTNPEGLISN